MSKLTIGRIIKRTKRKLRREYRSFRRNYRLRYTITLIIGIGLIVFLGLEYNMSNKEEEKPENSDRYYGDGYAFVRPTDVYGNEIPDYVDIEDKDELEKYVYPESSITSLPTEIQTDPINLHVLVNKDYGVDMYYEPDDLIEPDVPFNFDEEDEKRYLRKEAAHALERMFEQADKEGIYLEAVSGFRSYGRQQLLFRNNLRRNGLEYTSLYSAMPGRSEHQTGWAMDITSNSVDNKLSSKFGETVEGKWVEKNCYKFGFVIRYPKGKEDITGYAYEPWHIRYVGYNLARFLYDNDLTLDQYYGYVLDKDAIYEREKAYYDKYMASLKTEPPVGTKNPLESPLPTDDPEDVIEDIPDVSMPPTDAPTSSKEPENTDVPDEPDKPLETDEPENSETPKPSKTPQVSETPLPTDEPQNTDAPVATDEPVVTDKPIVTDEPEATDEPVVTDTPIVTDEPVATDEPTPTDTPSQDENQPGVDLPLAPII